MLIENNEQTYAARFSWYNDTPIDVDQLAAQLKRVKPSGAGLGAWAACVLATVEAAETTWPKFDREWFLRATGYTPC